MKAGDSKDESAISEKDGDYDLGSSNDESLPLSKLLASSYLEQQS